MKTTDLLLGALTAAAATLVAGVLWLHGSLRAGELPLPAAALAASTEEGRRFPFSTGGDPEQGRTPLVPHGSTAPAVPPATTLAGLERAAELALAEERTDAERIEALRAAWAARVPRAAELLATAVRTLPDASRAETVSVPRFALACLLREAAGDDSARRALASIAWDARGPVTPELRRLAAAGLAQVASADEAGEIAVRLRAEPDALVREAAARALGRNERAWRLTEAQPAGSARPAQGDPAAIVE